MANAQSDLEQILTELRVSREQIAERALTLSQSRQALRASWEHYAQFHDSLRLGFLMLDGQGTIRSISAAGARLLGKEVSQAQGSAFSSYISQADRSKFERHLAKCAGQASAVATELALEAPSGMCIPVQLTTWRFPHETEVVYWAAMRDVSEHGWARQAIDELRRLTALALDIGKMLTQEDSLADALARCVNLLASHMEGVIAHIWTFDEAKNALELAGSAGQAFDDGPPSYLPLGELSAGLVALSRQPRLRRAVPGKGWIQEYEWARRERVVASAVFPLLVGEKLVGVLGVYARTALSAETLVALGALATAVALGIERRRGEEALRDSEARYRLLFESNPHPMWVWDQETMRILAVNEAAVRVYGYTRDAFLTMSADEITAGQVIELDRWDSGSNPVTAGIVHAGIWKQRRKGGDLFDAEIAACSISFDGREAWLVSANDVTDRLRAEETLKEADRRKDEFLAMLAHELRNPLAALSHALELQQLVPDETIKRHAHEMMDRQVKHLGRLVDDLLDVSRITRGKIVLRRETVDMAALVKNAVVAVRGLIEQRHQQLFLELPPDPVWTRGDPIRLEQVVVNLLNNASKYSDPGSQIRLILEARSDATELRVRDNGIGIDADMLPRIFDLFAQSDRSLDRSTGGLGIGLTLAQRLVELHGGSISVSSGGRGQGSEFTVSLPIVTEPASISSTAECTVDRSAPLRLLIIEDNTDAAESLRMLLGMIGHEVVYVAHDGRSGLEAVCLHHPDVVLLDIGLPTMDGYAVARELRTRSELAGISLIAMTGYGQDEDQRRAREAGFDYHVTKPVGVASLEALFAQIRPAIAPARELVTSKTD